MKHNYVSCDCCGKVINTSGLITYYKIKHSLLRFGPRCSNDGDRVDICQNCWDDIREYVKEKRNATMA